MFERELRDLAFVPRWVITRNLRTQSVAEHSFFVAVYAEQIADLIAWPFPRGDMEMNRAEWASQRMELLHAALWHDAEECFTGDIPGPTKRNMMDPAAYTEMVKEGLEDRFSDQVQPISESIRKILKVANLLDEVLYKLGEIRMGNTDAKHSFTLSHERLFTAWRQLPADAAELNGLYRFVTGAMDAETYGQSMLPVNNRDVASKK